MSKFPARFCQHLEISMMWKVPFGTTNEWAWQRGSAIKKTYCWPPGLRQQRFLFSLRASPGLGGILWITRERLRHSAHLLQYGISPWILINYIYFPVLTHKLTEVQDSIWFINSFPKDNIILFLSVLISVFPNSSWWNYSFFTISCKMLVNTLSV